METRANHVIIGLFLVVVFTLLVGFALWTVKFATKSEWHEYDVVFSEAVTGLGIGGTVQYNGITVGAVRNLSIDEVNPQRVIARIRIKAGTPIKVDTEAQLAIVGLTGISQIQLKSFNRNSQDLVGTEDNPAPRIFAKESALSKLFNSTGDLSSTASNLLLRLNKTFSDDNIKNLSATLKHLEQISGSVANERQDLALIIKDARAVISKLDSTLQSTDSIAKKLDQGVINDLPQIIAKLDAALIQYEKLGKNANHVLESNQEAIDNFAQQGLTQVGPALVELRSLLKQLRLVAEEIESRPNALITGKNATQEFKP